MPIPHPVREHQLLDACADLYVDIVLHTKMISLATFDCNSATVMLPSRASLVTSMQCERNLTQVAIFANVPVCDSSKTWSCLHSLCPDLPVQCVAPTLVPELWSDRMSDLEQVAALLEKDGWTQQRYGFFHGQPHCLVGAVDIILDTETERGKAALKKLLYATGDFLAAHRSPAKVITLLIDWNDCERRTVVEVEELIKTAMMAE